MEDVLRVWPIIAFMALQSAAAIWWAATINSKVVQLEKDRDDFKGHGERMIRLEAAIEHMASKIEDLVGVLRSGKR